MLREMLRSKIHRATVTEANLDYAGSLSLDTSLMEAAGMLPFEKILVVNIQNGVRFETYLIEGKPGEVCLNGAAARLGEVGDEVIIMSFAMLDEQELGEYRPRVVHVDDRNAVVNVNG